MRCLLVTVPVLAALCSCDRSSPPPATAPPASTAGATIPDSLFLASAPAEAKPLEEVKATAKPGDTVVLRGRVGGSEAPFVDGRAVLTLVGAGLAACSDDPEDTCKTPWDYCCETPDQIAAHSATIQVADKDGQPVKTGLKGLHGLKELSDITVAGTVAQAEGGVLIVSASGVYVNP
jgi:hypothetical protein